MKNISVIFLFAVLILSGCGKSDNKITENKSSGENSEKTKNDQKDNKSDSQTETAEIKLPTMQCSTCKKTIESALRKTDGVNEANVIVKEKIAKISFDRSKTDLNRIEGVIVMAGYQANDRPADKDAYDKLEKCCKVGGH